MQTEISFHSRLWSFRVGSCGCAYFPFGLPDSTTDIDRMIAGLTVLKEQFTDIQKYQSEQNKQNAEILSCRPQLRLPQKRGRDREGYVYLMANLRNGLYKIGFSNNPRFRERTLQSEEPEVRLVAAFWSTLGAEEAMQIKYSDSRIRGEWFRLSPRQLREFCTNFDGRASA